MYKQKTKIDLFLESKIKKILREMKVENNKVVFESEDYNLTELDLMNKNLTEIHDGIEKFTKLTSLYLGGNNITSVSSKIGKLTKLNYLDLSGNKLSKLPNEISKLTNLKELWLFDNKFTSKEENKIEKLLPNCKIVF